MKIKQITVCTYMYACSTLYTYSDILFRHDSVAQESQSHDSTDTSVLLQYSAAPPSLFAPEMSPSLLSPAQQTHTQSYTCVCKSYNYVDTII